MFIGNVTAQQVSTLVWSAATRTLTADPATDAGAAALVWTHATRTLTADPATDAGAAALVWGHATRTLTADPATDAGAATLVWTHATRTLTADPATDAGAATLVWTHATRTLTADPATDAGAATLVWTHSTRSLTALGAVAIVNATNVSLASGSVADLRPAAGKFRDMTVGVLLSGTSAAQIELYDGTNSFVLMSQNTGSFGYDAVATDSTVGIRVNNNVGGSNALHYAYCASDWTV